MHRTSSPLMQCCPNVSEGRNQETISSLIQVIKSTDGCHLLHVDSNPIHNRTVFNFVGEPEVVVSAAISLGQKVFELIDMRKHHGDHKRLGSLDVVPFVHLNNCSQQDSQFCARDFSFRLSDLIQCPIYLFGSFPQLDDHRQTISQVRGGEYEGLKEKLMNPEWKPDFGPTLFVPHFGACMVTSREFVLPMNVNLIGTKEQAHRMALNIRGSGRGVGQEGLFPSVQGQGYFLKDRNVAQVNLNILDTVESPPHLIYDNLMEQAMDLGVPIVGTEFTCPVPLNILLDAAEHYIDRDSLFVLEEDQKVMLAKSRMGITSKVDIIEHMVKKDPLGKFESMSVHGFIHAVGDRSTSPACGSVNGLVAGVAIALASMVAKLSYGKKSVQHLDPVMKRLIPPLHDAMDHLSAFIDRDTTAYKDYILAMRLPSTNPEEEAVKEASIDIGLKQAVNVPFNLATSIDLLWPTVQELAPLINYSSIADLQVAVNLMKVSILGCYYNVTTNLKDPNLRDDTFRETALQDMDRMVRNGDDKCKEILDLLSARTC